MRGSALQVAGGRALLAAALVGLAALTAPADPDKQPRTARACREAVDAYLKPLRLQFSSRPPPQTRRPELVGRELWPWTTSDIAVPVVVRGWRDVDGLSVRLAVNAAGVMYMPRVVFTDEPSPSEMVKVSQVGDRLRQALREGRREGRRRITIVADRSVRASVVLDVVRRAPPGTPVALVVGKPASAIAKEHRRTAPFTPPRVMRAIEKALARHHGQGLRLVALADEPDMLAEMWRSFGDCEGIRKAWRLVGQGGGGEVFFPALFKALEECECRNVDLPTLASVMIFVFNFSKNNGWIPLDAAALRAASTLRADANVAELARALTSG
jgi:hypothetical protein